MLVTREEYHHLAVVRPRNEVLSAVYRGQHMFLEEVEEKPWVKETIARMRGRSPEVNLDSLEA